MAEQEQMRIDPIDGLLAGPVGEWAKEKHDLLKFYIEITRGVRNKYLGVGKAGATFIDLYCGSGRAYIRDSETFIDGSPLVAWKASANCGCPFSEIHINDNNRDLLEAAHDRLVRLNAPVIKHGGNALNAVDNILRNLNPYGLHFALIDPFSLALPFGIIKNLSGLRRIDLLIHVSAMDLQRNWRVHVNAGDASPLDAFAPGWRQEVNMSQPEENIRLEYIRYWIRLLKSLGFEEDVQFELIKGSKNQPLYWLVLVAKHEIATRFWKKARPVGKTQEMF